MNNKLRNKIKEDVYTWLTTVYQKPDMPLCEYQGHRKRRGYVFLEYIKSVLRWELN